MSASDPADLAGLADALASTALLGTERRPFAVPAPPGSPAPGSGPDPAAVDEDGWSAALAALAASGLGQEELVGLSAALLDVATRAGAVPGPGLADPDADPEPSAGARVEQPVPSAAASQILDLLLGGNVAIARRGDELIGRWLAGCARHGRRVEVRQLVELLTRATSVPSLRMPAVAVLGPRGHLLGRANPAWAWVHEAQAVADAAADAPVSAIDPSALAVAEPAARPLLVRAWRERDPSAAREAVLAAAAALSPPERAAIVEALEVGLGPEDEATLEQLLDDRAKAVRAAAARLLSRLPASAWLARMTARIAAVAVRTTPKGALELGLPAEEAIDRGWARDGIDGSAGAAIGLKGKRALALVGLAQLAPLTVWERVTGDAPAELVRAAGRSDVAGELVLGWGVAAAAQHAAEWASALLDAGGEPSLVMVLPPHERDARITRTLRSVRDLSGLYAALRHVPSPMPEALADELVAAITRVPAVPVDAHWLEPLLADASAQALDRLFRHLGTEATVLRHLQAAQSLRSAIDKEFP